MRETFKSITSEIAVEMDKRYAAIFAEVKADPDFEDKAMVIRLLQAISISCDDIDKNGLSDSGVNGFCEAAGKLAGMGFTTADFEDDFHSDVPFPEIAEKLIKLRKERSGKIDCSE